MSRGFHFTRTEIAAELKRCGYPLTSEEDVERFEHDLAALYADGKFHYEDLTETSYNTSDKFYDLPPPLRDDVDFSKYYTKSQTSDCLLPQSVGDDKRGYSRKNLTGEPPKLHQVSSRSAPNSGRGEKPGSSVSTALNSSTTKRKVLRKSDDGSSFVDEFMLGRTLPSLTKTKKFQLPLVADDDDDQDQGAFEGMPPLEFDYGSNQQLEDKISRLTLVSEGAGSSGADSPIMRRSYEVHSNKPRKTSGKNNDDQSPLRMSDRDNRQVNGGKATAVRTAGSSSDSGFLPSVISRPIQAVSKASKRVMAQDPVTRYAEYAKGWRNQRAPGEKAHKELRWQIRGQMLARDETIMSGGRRTLASSAATSGQKTVQGPNTYVIPTEKKRQALRWAIRSALATGRQPPTGTRYVNRAFLSG